MLLKYCQVQLSQHCLLHSHWRQQPGGRGRVASNTSHGEILLTRKFLLFFFFFLLCFVLFFCFSLLKTTEICFGSTKNGNFLLRKKHFMPGKRSGKMTIPPLKNIPLMPLCIVCIFLHILGAWDHEILKCTFI